jgi:hypothetical protein
MTKSKSINAMTDTERQQYMENLKHLMSTEGQKDETTQEDDEEVQRCIVGSIR